MSPWWCSAFFEGCLVSSQVSGSVHYFAFAGGVLECVCFFVDVVWLKTYFGTFDVLLFQTNWSGSSCAYLRAATQLRTNNVNKEVGC